MNSKTLSFKPSSPETLQLGSPKSYTFDPEALNPAWPELRNSGAILAQAGFRSPGRSPSSNHVFHQCGGHCKVLEEDEALQCSTDQMARWESEAEARKQGNVQEGPGEAVQSAEGQG